MNTLEAERVLRAEIVNAMAAAWKDRNQAIAKEREVTAAFTQTAFRLLAAERRHQLAVLRDIWRAFRA